MTGLRRGLHRAGIRPRLRRRELTLLLVVGLALVTGWASLAAQQAGTLDLGEPTLLIVYLGVLLAIHVAFLISGRRMDQYLLPTAGMLGGLSLLLMMRLPQGMAGQSLFGTLVYSDLGSTNGSYLQGSRVHEIALGPHDVIQLGGSSLTIEPAAD